MGLTSGESRASEVWGRIVSAAAERRRQMRLSQADLAHRAGVSRPTVVRFEKGDTSVKVATAVAIVSALGLIITASLPTPEARSTTPSLDGGRPR